MSSANETPFVTMNETGNNANTSPNTFPTSSNNDKPVNPRSRIFRPCLTCRRRKISVCIPDVLMSCRIGPELTRAGNSAIRPDPNARDAHKPAISAKDMAKNAISSMSFQPGLQLRHRTVAEAAGAVTEETTTAMAARTITDRKESRFDHRDNYRQTICNNSRYGNRTVTHSCAHHNFPV